MQGRVGRIFQNAVWHNVMDLVKDTINTGSIGESSNYSMLANT